MRHVARNAVRGAFGALVVAGLGFGGGQALASPAEAQGAAATCSRTEVGECTASCIEEFGPNWRGRCTRDVFGNVNCQCIEFIFP